MQLNKIAKCVTTSVLFSQLISYSGMSYAEEQQTNSKAKQEMAVEQTSPSPQGLMGYYYQDQKFQKLALMGHRQSTNLKVLKSEVKDLLPNDRQQIQSARWVGYIKPSQTGKYVFSTPADQHVIIQLDGNVILNKASMNEPIQLEKDKQYKIKIEYVPEQTETKDTTLDFQLNWAISGGKAEQVPDSAFLLPDLSRKQDKEKIIPEKNLFQNQGEEKKSSRSKRSLAAAQSEDIDESRDTDDDAIPDQWEKNGYTIQNKVAVKWADSMKEKGYKKYVSDPLNSHTARDPYTDWEKAAGYIDAAVKPEARNPLVAAFPSVGVSMEKLIISNNQNISSQQGKSISASTSSSSTDQNMVGVDVTAGLSYGTTGISANFQVTGHYSHTWSNTSTVENSSSNNWSQDIGINTGQSAYLNANVRYYNTGTAPIYNVKPTTNFVLGGDSIVTVKAKENQLGDVLSAGGTYPNQQQSPIALNTLDDFGSQLISINYNQMKRLESGEPLNLQTTQASGLFGIIKANGGLNVDPSQEWDPVKEQIEKTSASIILDTGDETLERRVAAKDYNDPENLTPEVTLGEAIKIAFDATEKDGELYYKDLSLREGSIGIVFDKATAQEVRNQLDKMPDQNKKLYNVKIKRGMNIMLKQPVWFDRFEHNDHANWSNNLTIERGKGNKGDAGYFRKTPEPLYNNDTRLAYVNLNEQNGLKPNTAYIFSAYVKSSTSAKVRPFYGDVNGFYQMGFVTNANNLGYQRVQMKFITDEKGTTPQYKSLGFEILEGEDIFVDDAMLLELKPATNEDALEQMMTYVNERGNINHTTFAPLRETTQLEVFMNGRRLGTTYLQGKFFSAHGTGFPYNPSQTLNPENRFEFKYKGKTVASFNGGKGSKYAMWDK